MPDDTRPPIERSQGSLPEDRSKPGVLRALITLAAARIPLATISNQWDDPDKPQGAFVMDIADPARPEHTVTIVWFIDGEEREHGHWSAKKREAVRAERNRALTDIEVQLMLAGWRVQGSWGGTQTPRLQRVFGDPPALPLSAEDQPKHDDTCDTLNFRPDFNRRVMRKVMYDALRYARLGGGNVHDAFPGSHYATLPALFTAGATLAFVGEEMTTLQARHALDWAVQASGIPAEGLMAAAGVFNHPDADGSGLDWITDMPVSDADGRQVETTVVFAVFLAALIATVCHGNPAKLAPFLDRALDGDAASAEDPRVPLQAYLADPEQP